MSKHDATILLVEDEPTLQFVFERQLKKLGYKVEQIIANGTAAVDTVLAKQFQLVFMDIRLPGLDGMSATEKIRSQEAAQGKHTKIIGMTAFAERERCLQSGMDDFLQKPVLLEQLNVMLDKWLSDTSQAEHHEQSVSPGSQFDSTSMKLASIQNRISELRKRVGLETNE